MPASILFMYVIQPRSKTRLHHQCTATTYGSIYAHVVRINYARLLS